ncbi:G surface protein, allelic form 156-like [Anneissia japonica]|uniref:G surface protein, allelic form 156-like n=1 Tax=Anneissia japonica TaxID=1529436 RepID=UPI001425B0BA|nr:G surface protein, allelic form 156-like [Anneissia japonica]
MAPAYANIYMAYFEDSCVYRHPLQPLQYVRYIDDVFFIWPHGEDSLQEFISSINNTHHNIRFTASQSFTDIAFLNVLTATFQAALITDGVYSFVIFNYEIGGMLWNPDVLAQKNLVIGYGVGANANRTFNNVQLDSRLFPTEDSRYFPDSTSNTGLDGQWFFRLEDNNENTINYRQYCMNWRQTESDDLYWLDRLGTCPCAFGQGSNDLGFGRGRRGRRGRNQDANGNGQMSPLSPELLNDIENISGTPFCLQTQVASASGAGMRCCYRGDGSLIEGYENDVFTSSFVQRYQFVEGPFFNFWIYLYWLYFDLIPQYVCCERSNDPYYCNLYSEVRPKGTCNGYLPPNTGWMFGDPHIRTLDGLEYTFNGIGEFVLVTVNEGDFVLQGRMEKPVIEDENVLATIFSAFAAQERSTKVQMTLNASSNDFAILVNGSIVVNKTSLAEGPYTPPADPGFIISLPSGNSTGNRVIASWLSGIAISVGLSGPALDVVVSIPESFKGSTKGLYGVWNDNVTDDLTYPNNSMMSVPENGTLTDSDAFYFGVTWRTTDQSTLFTYSDGESWNTLNNLTFVPVFLEDLIEENEGTALYNEAIQECGDDRMCLFDALATSDISFGVNTMEINNNNNENADELANFPPNITSVIAISPENALNGTNRLMVMVDNQYILRINASDPEGDPITYSLEDIVPGGGIDTDGYFFWTPGSTDQVLLTLVAMDNKGAATAFPLEVIICECQNGGVCDFNALVDGSDLLNNRFAVSECNCPAAWTGTDCSDDYNACLDEPCYTGVACFDQMAPLANVTCGSCPSGLIGNGFKCYDYNECVEGRDREDGVEFCEQECTNTLGSYTCSCREGYDLDVGLKTCNDIDECMMMRDDCSNQALCTNTEGSFNCTCLDGYSGDGKTCNNINECGRVDFPCDINAECTDTDGSFVCQCTDGYEGNGQTCEDIDECARSLHTCDIHAVCMNTQGFYMCACASGWTGNGTICQDVNECNNMLPCSSERYICENTPGSFACSCPNGYYDGSPCMDIDECTSGTHNCSDTAMCVNTNGGFECPCRTGYNLTDGTCQDIDECAAVLKPCDVNADCENTIGGFDCTCHSGYTQSGSDCDDINECELNIDNCQQMCNNTDGSYNCSCNTNYVLQNDGMSCQPIQGAECTNNPCVNAFCSMNGGEVECLCKQGYESIDGNSTHCQNINECTSGDHMCSENCVDTEGSYNCSCSANYQLSDNQRDCDDINECGISDSCSENAMCINAPGTYICSCNSGYSGNGQQCNDIDECEHIRLYCSGNETCDYERCDDAAFCTNTNGSYMCQCKGGFTGSGKICFDVNECSSMPCDSMATCENTPGNYSCTCNDGFAGNGITCQNIDECEYNGTCNENAECTDTEGAFQCNCHDGFRGDGITSCNNIDECAENTADCHADATCTDTPGSFTCMCNAGFNGTGQNCENINECASSDLNNCDENASCMDSVGSYLCVCNGGYMSNDGGSAIEGNCDDIDECMLNIHNCSNLATCQNTPGGFECSCGEGYQGDGYQCSDINECEMTNNCNIDEKKQCNNVEGNYTCVCMNNFVEVDGTCVGALTMNMVVNFTDIKGIVVSVQPAVFDSVDIRNGLVNDVYTLFQSSSIGSSILQISVDSYRQIPPLVEVTFRLDLPTSTNLTLNDVTAVFYGGLTGAENTQLQPDSAVFYVMMPVVTTTQQTTATELTTTEARPTNVITMDQTTITTAEPTTITTEETTTGVASTIVTTKEQTTLTTAEPTTEETTTTGAASTIVTTKKQTTLTTAEPATTRSETTVEQTTLTTAEPATTGSETTTIEQTTITTAEPTTTGAGSTIATTKKQTTLTTAEPATTGSETTTIEQTTITTAEPTTTGAGSTIVTTKKQTTLTTAEPSTAPVTTYNVRLEITSEVYVNELEDSTSPLYIEYEQKICNSIRALFDAILECSVLSFENGSIIANVQVEFPEDTTTSEGIQAVLAAVENGMLPDTDFVINTEAITVTEVESCTSDYCYNGGTCYENDGTPVCKCVSDYEGEKCQDKKDTILYVAIALASVVSVIVIVCTIVFVCLCLYRKNLYQQKKITAHPKNRHNRHQTPYQFGYLDSDSLSSSSHSDRLVQYQRGLMLNSRTDVGGYNRAMPTTEFRRPYVVSGDEQEHVYDNRGRDFNEERWLDRRRDNNYR